MATQADLDRAVAWARAQVGKPYVLGAFGNAFDCSTYMSGIATMIRDGEATRWFTTHPFHSGGTEPLPGWERGLEAPFMIGIQDSGVGHTGGTLLGVDYEATAAGDRVVRMGASARGAKDPYYDRFYGFRPSILDDVPTQPDGRATHEVQPGDTYWRLSQEYDVTVSELEAWNSVPADQLQVGTILYVGPPLVAEEDPELDRGVINGVTVIGVYADGLPVPNSTIPSAVPLQRQLKRVGYMPNSIAEADNYGPATQAAVSKFHADHPKYAQGGGSDVSIGPSGWNHLKKHADDSAHNNPQPDTTPPSGSGEPAHVYTRVTYGGRTVNVRTREMLNRAEVRLGRTSDLPLAQGSYSGSVSASAGTHSGGGAVDILSSDWTIAKALRQEGFAAWVRSPSEGPWGYHIHAVAIGDREMSSAARNQVAAYFNGRNALANNRADSAPSWVGRPYPTWAAKYK